MGRNTGNQTIFVAIRFDLPIKLRLSYGKMRGIFYS